MNLTGSSHARKLVVSQLAVTLIAALLLLVAGWIYAMSGLIGGAIATVANAVFARRVFVRYRAQEPGKLLGKLYGAELQKLLLTGVLFALIFIWIRPLSAGALFSVYLLVQLMPVLMAHKLN